MKMLDFEFWIANWRRIHFCRRAIAKRVSPPSKTLIRNPRSKIRNCRGFTLLELILASMMTALLAMSLYGMLRIGFRARDSATRYLGPVRQMQWGAELVRQDLAAALPPGGVMVGAFIGENEAAAGGENDNVSFYRSASATLPDYRGLEASGGLFRNSLQAGAAAQAQAVSAGDVEYVELYCQPEGAGLALVRRRITNLLSTEADQSVPEVLARGIKSFGLRYFDGLEWLEDWDSSVQDNYLPLAVEFAIEWLPDQPGAANGRIVRQVVPLACARWDLFQEMGGLGQ